MKKYIVVYPDSGLIYPYDKQELAEKGYAMHKMSYFNLKIGWVEESDLKHDWKYINENKLFNEIEI